MKLSKSKLALAKLINENGGWPCWAWWCCQNNWNGHKVVFTRETKKPYRRESWNGWHVEGGILDGGFFTDKKIHNWHQTVLSREEYYQAYPKADADGWIEWEGGECPVDGESVVDVEFNAGKVISGVAKGFSWFHEWEYSNIVKYRIKPDANPEPCESVASSIPESDVEAAKSRLGKALWLVKSAAPHLLNDKYKFVGDEAMGERKPTIEQLAQDYRNAKDYAVRLQKEAGEAAVKAESLAVEIRKKILELRELIG